MATRAPSKKKIDAAKEELSLVAAELSRANEWRTEVLAERKKLILLLDSGSVPRTEIAALANISSDAVRVQIEGKKS